MGQRTFAAAATASGLRACPVLILFLFSLGGLLWNFSQAANPEPAGILIRPDDDSGIAVELTRNPERTLGDQKGLWIVPGDSTALCIPLPRAETAASQQGIALPALGGATRGDVSSDGQAVALSTPQLDQLASGEIVRDITEGGFLTPVDQGFQLSPQITIRRRPRQQEPQYPAETCLLTVGTSKYEFAFPAGVSTLKWKDLQGLPAELKSGLPPGQYLLRMKNSGAESTFQIVPEEIASFVKQKTQTLRAKLAPHYRNLADQIYMESLLQAEDQQGQPISFLADAFDVLDRAELSPHLQQIHDDLLERLSGSELIEEDDENAELAEVDWARDLIARGQWQRAIDVLQSPAAHANPRSARLAKLYLGVALAESSATLGGAADAEFQAALQGSDNVDDADAYRIHNNYGNFLLRKIQNGLNNRSLTAASGGSGSLFDLFSLWHQAANEYEKTIQIGQRLGDSSESAARVSLARHYALLSDLLFTVNATLPSEQRMPELEVAATQKSHELAEQALLPTSTADLATRAAAAETLAQLAHRQGNSARCQGYAQIALEAYIDMGSLIGAEGIFRMKGLSLLKESPLPNEDTDDHSQSALEALMLSHLLAEHLRSQYPGDTIGLSRAGFLARRAYVTDRMVELLIEQSDFVTALELLETSKARALQDMLSSQSSQSAETEATTELSEILNSWPTGTVALEYFLGTEHPWVFCVSGPESVTAHPLLDTDGKPLQTTEFIARVHTFLNQMEGTASKLLRSTAPGQPFDSAWQDELHRFWQELIPAEVQQQLGENRNVIIIPQHLLHYFPFAALVTEVDTAKRGAMESAMPQFWIESGVNLTNAPSLTAWHSLRSTGEQTAHLAKAIGIAAFANAKPLPGVNSDLANLKRNFADLLKTTETGSGVTEKTLRELIEQPGLVFIGTHGANLPDNPLSSYLLCHADSENDGHFMAGEIYGSRFHSCIAILSACYSGLADRSPVAGDDLFGIERALLHAGVRTVVDGVWDVYDATGTEIMNHVFAALLAGRTTPAAVAEAQRQFLKDRRAEGPSDPWIHPYFWSVYKVSGSDLTHFEQEPPRQK